MPLEDQAVTDDVDEMLTTGGGLASLSNMAKAG
jgi:hypothetical protein